MIGAIWLLDFLDYNMSVAVWVGLIALAGLDTETGVVMLLYLTLAHHRRRLMEGTLRSVSDLEEAIVGEPRHGGVGVGVTRVGVRAFSAWAGVARARAGRPWARQRRRRRRAHQRNRI